MSKTKATLYLFPTPLDEHAMASIPAYHLALLHSITYYIVEAAKTARQFLKKSAHPTALQEITIVELNEHTKSLDYSEFLKPLLAGINVGLLSEAGCPAIADPGAPLILAAHNAGIQVVPLVGPSSIFLALMASGLNGQNFAFVGYLPRDRSDRIKKIKELELLAR